MQHTCAAFCDSQPTCNAFAIGKDCPTYVGCEISPPSDTQNWGFTYYMKDAQTSPSDTQSWGSTYYMKDAQTPPSPPPGVVVGCEDEQRLGSLGTEVFGWYSMGNATQGSAHPTCESECEADKHCHGIRWTVADNKCWLLTCSGNRDTDSNTDDRWRYKLRLTKSNQNFNIWIRPKPSSFAMVTFARYLLLSLFG